MAVDGCSRLNRPELSRLLRMELGTNVEVLETDSAAAPADVFVRCSSSTVYLNVSSPALDATPGPNRRVLPGRVLTSREAERLLALAIAELVAASTFEPPPTNGESPPATAPPETAANAPRSDTPAATASAFAAKPSLPATTGEPPQRPVDTEVPPATSPRDHGTSRLGLTAFILTVPLRTGPTWYGGRAWFSQQLIDSTAIEFGAGYSLGSEQSTTANVQSQLVSGHVLLRYLTNVGHVMIDVAVGGMISYLRFDGNHEGPEQLASTKPQFVNGGPSVQFRVTTDTNPVFAGLTLEAAAFLQPVAIIDVKNRELGNGTLIASVRGVWIGLGFDLGFLP